MSETRGVPLGKRKDHKGRILQTGERQRKDLIYQYRYTDIRGKRQTIQWMVWSYTGLLHYLLHHLPENLRRFTENSVGFGQNIKIEKSAGKPVISRLEGL